MNSNTEKIQKNKMYSSEVFHKGNTHVTTTSQETGTEPRKHLPSQHLPSPTKVAIVLSFVVSSALVPRRQP